MKIIYTCPKCGEDLIEEIITVYPPIRHMKCSNCGWSDEEKEDVIRIPYAYDKIDFPDPCKNCSNNPQNGGSGICHCILGTKVIY